MAGIAGAIVESMATHERKASDNYPTRDLRATRGMLNAIRPPKSITWLEPACGEGHISRVLTEEGYNVISTDIRHTGYGVGGVNYLEQFYEEEFGVCTNPPFYLAEEFIRHAMLNRCPFLILLLKSDFFNSDYGKRLNAEFPVTGFAPVPWRIAFLKKERGNNPIMNCSWFIWERGRPGIITPMDREGPEELPNLTLGVAVARWREAQKANEEARRAYLV